MQKGIEITFPVRKKNQVDTYRTLASYSEFGNSRCFTLPETNQELMRKHHLVTEGCMIEDLITGERFKCFHVNLTEGRTKHPIMMVEPV